jgi:hypothetical protein
MISLRFHIKLFDYGLYNDIHNKAIPYYLYKETKDFLALLDGKELIHFFIFYEKSIKL